MLVNWTHTWDKSEVDMIKFSIFQKENVEGSGTIYYVCNALQIGKQEDGSKYLLDSNWKNWKTMLTVFVRWD